MKTFRIGSRRSPLALRQVDEVVEALKAFYPGFRYDAVLIDTRGDKDKCTPIAEIEGGDFFTREIEDALLKGDIDFAVHSAKDMPDVAPPGLVVAAVTRPLDSSDALVSRSGLTIDKLPQGAKIGASSGRRKAQLGDYRRDFQVVDIRGTINERLAQLDQGARGLDAVIIAACALMRLGLERRITQKIPCEIMKPHPLQGALAIEARGGDAELIELLKVLHCGCPLLSLPTRGRDIGEG